MITDFTEGSIHRKLWSFSLPMLISVMFQQIYNIADSIIAGRFAGEDALAAVGASYPVTMLFLAVAMGCNTGCSVVISQLFGARDLKNMKTAIYTTFLSCAALSIILTAAGLLSSASLMVLIRTPENIFDDGKIYLNIYIAGLVFLFMYNVCTGIFNALGDSRTPLCFLIASSVGNIVLDLVFVICFRMGVAGVAWATFIAQGVSAVLSFLTLLKRVKGMETHGKAAVFSLSMLGKISRIAVPGILQQSFISIGNFFVQGLVNSYGSAVIAGYSAAIRLNTFTITSITTAANGLSSFTAQNIGAGKVERIKKGFCSGILLAILLSLPFFIAFTFFGDKILLLFMKSGSGPALETGRSFLRIVAPFYLVIAVKLTADGVLRGAGAMKSFMTATFTDLILRVILAFILSAPLGINGIWMSWPIGWSIAACLSLAFYRKGVWIP